MNKKFNPRICLTLILCLEATLGFIYLKRTAIFNAPDEPYHLAYVDFLAAKKRLPVDAAAQYPMLSEAIQPPLYYFLALPLYRLVEARPIAARVWTLRAQNLFYSILNVLMIFILLRRVGNEKTAVLGAAFAAFLPQYLFISVSVSNDPLADLLATISLYCGARLLESRSWRWTIATGLSIGLGLLAKLTTACCATAVFLIYAWQQRKNADQMARRSAVIIALGALLAAGPFLRNWSLYGDFAGRRAMRESAMRWNEIGPWCVKLFSSFWGFFAWMASPLPGPLYAVLALATIAVIGGFALRARSHPQVLSNPGARLLLGALCLALFQAFYQGFLQARQPQGRYLFPALAPVCFIFAMGVYELWDRIPRKIRPALGAIVILGELILQFFSLRAL
ncbi:MAG: ArnT family glycosyltransferase [Elusimicrobiota bacterium]